MSAQTSQQALELLLFATDPRLVAEATEAGMDGFIVDWERRGKYRRQAGEGTQINNDTLEDLQRVRAATRARLICRINGFGAWTRHEIEEAIAAGADEILLPMVRDAAEVDQVLAMAVGRCGVGILIETRAGVAAAAELARRPLSRVYVGLNDLRIDRGSSELFAPLADGTVDRVRAAVEHSSFGVAGLTLPDRGHPVPSSLLAAELIRIDAQFTFLRRSFLADTGGTSLGPAVAAIRAQLDRLVRRSDAAVERDRLALLGIVAHPEVLPA
ncbi:MAG: aldolase/citrate lyase family protein [Nocardioides sp.]|uniref:aldolase/citrate lyase family protein n=1 Tax=Nocardioides sp. TaxID=35761 RepID=UPI0039E5DE70